MSTYLPFELWDLILRPLRPLRPVIPQGTKHKVYNINDYNQRLKKYAWLRLVCVDWHHVITPILYEEVAIVTNSSTNLQYITDLFKCGAPYIRSVIIHGALDQNRCHPLVQSTVEVVGRGLGLCTQIRNLECYCWHPTFTSRKWLSMYAPNLASTITSLVIRSYTPQAFSYSLVGLGRSLQRLEISGPFGDDRTGCPLHLPSAFPNLTHLTLCGSDSTETYLLKLLSRIVQKKGKVALRSLSIDDTGPADLFGKIFSHVGSHLTALSLLWTAKDFFPSQVRQVRQIAALQACPRLLEVSLIICSKEVLDYLPITIQTLELGIFPDRLITPTDLNMFFKSKRCSMLHTSSIRIIPHTSWSPWPEVWSDEIMKNPLKFTCNEVGIDLTIRIS